MPSPTTNLTGLHGHFNEIDDKTDERVAFGVYQNPALTDPVANHMRQALGDNSALMDDIRRTADHDTSADDIETLANSHPVWAVEVPDTIIHLELNSIWRDSWDTILNHEIKTVENGHDRVSDVHVKDELTGPPVTGESRFAFHYIDGQDMHLKTKLLGMTTASSYEEVIREFTDEYTPFRCPGNWEFEIVEIAAEHEYDSNTFDFPDRNDKLA